MSIHETYPTHDHEPFPAAELTRMALAVYSAKSQNKNNRNGVTVSDVEKLAQEAVEFAEMHPEMVIEHICVDSLKAIRDGSLRTEAYATAS